jgi:hypothetical protein
VLVRGSDVCGSERLSKRVYGGASFTEAPTVAGSLPVAVNKGAARSGPRFGACRFLLLAGYEDLTAPLFTPPQ